MARKTSAAVVACSSAFEPPGDMVPVIDTGCREVQALQAVIDRQRAEQRRAEACALGPAERSACEYVAELCEGLMLLDGVSRLPRLGYLLMLTHALASDYVAMPEAEP